MNDSPPMYSLLHRSKRKREACLCQLARHQMCQWFLPRLGYRRSWETLTLRKMPRKAWPKNNGWSLSEMISGERLSPSWGHRELFSFHTCLPGVDTCSEHGWGLRNMDEWGIDDPGLGVPVGGQDGGGLEDLRSKMRSPDPVITHHQSSPLTAFCWKSSWTGGLADSGKLLPWVHTLWPCKSGAGQAVGEITLIQCSQSRPHLTTRYHPLAKHHLSGKKPETKTPENKMGQNTSHSGLGTARWLK